MEAWYNLDIPVECPECKKGYVDPRTICVASHAIRAVCDNCHAALFFEIDINHPPKASIPRL